jgi:DNA adenine methylase
MSKKIVNVASVPQRSPFRYPGGKTWLVPHLRAWLRSLPQKPECFIEPFVGGGIISLTVAFENLASRVIIVELDENVAAVWKTLLDGNASWLASKIVEFEITHESVRSALSQVAASLRERAF